jgi:hypothetical protein
MATTPARRASSAWRPRGHNSHASAKVATLWPPAPRRAVAARPQLPRLRESCPVLAAGARRAAAARPSRGHNYCASAKVAPFWPPARAAPRPPAPRAATTPTPPRRLPRSGRRRRATRWPRGHNSHASAKPAPFWPPAPLRDRAHACRAATTPAPPRWRPRCGRRRPLATAPTRVARPQLPRLREGCPVLAAGAAAARPSRGHNSQASAKAAPFWPPRAQWAALCRAPPAPPHPRPGSTSPPPAPSRRRTRPSSRARRAPSPPRSRSRTARPSCRRRRRG